MITIAKSISEAIQAPGEYRAGGTDLQERRRSLVSEGDLVDISNLPELNRIEQLADGTYKIGALCTISSVARSEEIQTHYPALAKPLNSLGTPQVREMATIGGSLLQRTRCWYYRHPEFKCFKKGGNYCPARTGNHRFGVCFDLGACIHPHPSSIALPLLVYDAEVEIYGKGRIPVSKLYDAKNKYNDHQLGEEELLTHVYLPKPVPPEKVKHVRVTSRSGVEWPTVEVVIRIKVENRLVELVKIATGGVANVPLLMEEAAQLEGKELTHAVIQQLVGTICRKARPLPMTGYKVELLRNALVDALM